MSTQPASNDPVLNAPTIDAAKQAILDRYKDVLSPFAVLMLDSELDALIERVNQEPRTKNQEPRT